MSRLAYNQLVRAQAIGLLEIWYRNMDRFHHTQAVVFKTRGLVEHDRWIAERSKP